MISGGRATRLELYGCLLAVVIVVELMCERLAVDRAIVDGMLRHRSRPMVIQANHQELNVSMEHPIDKLVRELDEKKAREHGKQSINTSESASGRINRSDSRND